MNLVVMYRQVKQALTDIPSLTVRVNMLEANTAALLERLKAIEQPASQKGEAHATAPKRRGRPPKAASSD